MQRRRRGARAAGDEGLQPGVRRALPEARHRRAHQAADQRAVEGRLALRRDGRRTARSSSSRRRRRLASAATGARVRRRRVASTADRLRTRTRPARLLAGAAARRMFRVRLFVVCAGRSAPAARAPSPAPPCGMRPARTSSRTAARSAARIAGNSRSRNFMKWSRVPSCRYITLQPTKRAPWSAIALIVRSSLRARRGEAGHDRRHQHAGVDAGVDAARAPRAAAAAGARCPARACRHASSSTVGTLM